MTPCNYEDALIARCQFKWPVQLGSKAGVKMASRDILEAAGIGDQPPCVAAGLFFTDADVVVDEQPFRVHEVKGRIKTITHKVLNGPAKFRERTYNSDGMLNEELYYNIDNYKRVWKHTEWYSDGILARVCGYNYSSRYHGSFLTFYGINGTVKTNHVMNEGRRVHNLMEVQYDDQVFVACALAKEMKKLRGMFYGPPAVADDNDNDDNDDN